MYQSVILVRYGEIGLKGRNRPDFERALVRQIRRALRPWPSVAVSRFHGRIAVELPDQMEPEPLLEPLQRVFGIVSVSPARRVPLHLEAMAEAATTAVDEALRDQRGQAGLNGEPVSFKVAARRANKRFPLTSLDLNRELGSRLLAAFPQLRVDVHRPRITVAVEVRHDGAYVYTRSLPGAGGLPVGVTGRSCALLSGGIDSPVAVWMAMKRGLTVIPIHFHSPPYTSERAKEKVIDLVRVLARWGGPLRLHVVRFTEIQQTIQLRCPPAWTITLMRRMMFRLAERIAQRERALALVTGESLGQVASQTLESMRTIEAATSLPVLRPLVAMDKAEIIGWARMLGTYDISTLPYEDCCTLFVPRHPITRPRPEQAEALEADQDWEPLLEEALASTEVLDIDASGPGGDRGRFEGGSGIGPA